MGLVVTFRQLLLLHGLRMANELRYTRVAVLDIPSFGGKANDFYMSYIFFGFSASFSGKRRGSGWQICLLLLLIAER